MSEIGLYTRLKSVSAVQTLVAESTSPLTYRIYPLVIPQGQDRMPCIVYQKVSAERQLLLVGTNGTVRATYQVDSYATSASGALALAAAVQDALMDYVGTSGGVAMRFTSLENEISLEDPDPGLFRISQTYTCWYDE